MKTRNPLFHSNIYVFPGIVPIKEQNDPHFPCSLNFTPCDLRDGHWCVVRMEK